MTQDAPRTGSFTGIESVDRLLRVAGRLEAKGDRVAADRALRAARRVWDEQPSARRSVADDFEGVHRGGLAPRDEEAVPARS